MEFAGLSGASVQTVRPIAKEAAVSARTAQSGRTAALGRA